MLSEFYLSSEELGKLEAEAKNRAERIRKSEKFVINSKTTVEDILTKADVIIGANPQLTYSDISLVKEVDVYNRVLVYLVYYVDGDWETIYDRLIASKLSQKRGSYEKYLKLKKEFNYIEN